MSLDYGRESAGHGRLSYGEMRDKIEPHHIHGKPAPATIESCEERDLAPEGSRRSKVKLVMTFREFPKLEYICNTTSYKTLCEKHGRDHTRWIGKVVVLAPTTTEFDGRAYEKVHIAPPDAWDRVLQAAERATRGRKS